MQVDVQLKIKNNPNLYRFLRDNSSCYKYLNRSPYALKDMEEAMKKYYKLTPQDKLERLGESLSLLETFISIMR